MPWTLLGFFGVLLCLIYGSILYEMAVEWYTDDDMSHGFFVPAVAAWVIWEMRDQLSKLEPVPSKWGFVLLAFGAVQMFAGELGAEMFVARTAFLVSLVGLILAIGGWPYIRALAFPLFLLLFMIRIPAIVFKQVTFPLQLFASQVAEGVLTLIGIPVLREGNILELASQRLSVVEACSGIRSLLSLSFLALVYAHFFDAKRWMRWALLAATIPIAVAANALRVTLTGIVSEINTEWSQGFYHTMEGFVMFAIAAAILLAVHQVINRIYQATQEPDEPEPA